MHIQCLYPRYGDSVDNTVEENSNIFSIIQMCWVPSARACGQSVKLCTKKILQFLTGGTGKRRLTWITAVKQWLFSVYIVLHVYFQF